MDTGRDRDRDRGGERKPVCWVGISGAGISVSLCEVDEAGARGTL